MHILIVEDDEMLREMMLQHLELADHLVTAASNGEEGLEKARNVRPDLILMDITMPVLDGLEAIRRLKNDRSLRDIPVIALTARASHEDRQQALEAGADEYESKPIDFPRLLAKVELLQLSSPKQRQSQQSQQCQTGKESGEDQTQR